jgi:type II secretory pathway predicted ATPase ExeA
MTKHTQEALANLIYGIHTRKGFILLTGEVGTGKTTVINKMLEWAQQEKIETAFIFNPRLNEVEFFDFMMADFGISCESQLKSRVLLRLNEWLLERYRQGQRAVLVIDEAQNLSIEMLEEIRLLTNLETSKEKLLQIVLAGQPELEERLNLPGLRQLRQRIILRAKTRPLTLMETHGYVTERLRVAGNSAGEIFTTEAIEAISRYSKGIPRVINLICEHALINAFVEHNRSIPERIIQEVASDFQLSDATPSAAPAPASPGHPVLVDPLSTQRPFQKLSGEKKI